MQSKVIFVVVLVDISQKLQKIPIFSKFFDTSTKTPKKYIYQGAMTSPPK